MTEPRTQKAAATSSDAADPQGLPITRQTGVIFLRMLKSFTSSEVGWRATAMFFALLALLLAINGLNVLNSYVGRDFMTEIERRSMPGFVHQSLRYIGVFAITTVAAVILRFTEERLGLLWREWLTRRLVSTYLDEQIYHRLGSTITNPDQRIADDARTLTVQSLSFVLMVCNATMTIAAFAGVLWSISPTLFGVAVLYAIGGSTLTVLLGRRLVWLNFDQSDKEAYLRTNLIHLRENAESVALLQREGRLEARLLRNIDDLIANMKRIIAVNRNVSFFTTGYNYMIQVIPALIVAPMFIRGQAEFGVITQSAMAFSHLLGAFSLIVNQFGQISSYAAVVARLGSFGEAVDWLREAPPPPIEIRKDPNRIRYENVTLLHDATVLVERLSVTIPRGTDVLVCGANEPAKSALVRATAGLPVPGSGAIVRPVPGDLLVVPERPYLPPGTLREAILRTSKEGAARDERILPVLRSLGIEGVVDHVGGLDVENGWLEELSMAERQLLVVSRVILAGPHFVLLDRLDKTLSDAELGRVRRAFADNGITCVTISSSDGSGRETYGAELILDAGGAWRWNETSSLSPA